jgi:CRISPR-associated protein Cas1
MSWRILFIEESEFLSLYLDNIKVINHGDEILIPLSDINTLIIDNYKTNISVHLINALANYNVNTVFCGIDHMPSCISHPLSGHHKSAQVFKKQLKWTEYQKGLLHQLIITHKINNQIELLKTFCFDEDLAIMIRLSSEVEEADSTNREGLVAKMYFRKLFGDHFKRFNDDVINAGLNYGYAVLRSQISRIIISKGLNPSLGIFHKGPENDFNLSDDFIEPFRPIIDYHVYKHLMKDQVFTREHRLMLVEATTKSIYFCNKKQTIFNAMILYIEQILDYIDGSKKTPIDCPIIHYHEF